MGSGQGLQRALILLALASVVGCKAREREREPTGEAPAFHDQHLYMGTIEVVVPDEGLPAVFAVDVQRDTIHVGDAFHHLSFPRARGATHSERWHGGFTITVRNNDDVMLWRAADRSQDQAQVRAANTGDLEHAWTVLEYVRDEVLGDPLVVGERVAVMSKCCLIHAPILGGPPGVLALTHEPSAAPTSDGRRLVWVAQQGERELVLSADAALEAVEVVWEQPLEAGGIRAAAPVGESVTFVQTVSKSYGPTDQLLRVRADGSVVELLVGEYYGDDLRLLPDGKQAWLYAHRRLWWIGERSHAFVRQFDEELSAIGADDGLLLWQQRDGIHVAGQPTIELERPFPVHMARGGDDEDVWTGTVGNEIGEAYGVGGLQRTEQR